MHWSQARAHTTIALERHKQLDVQLLDALHRDGPMPTKLCLTPRCGNPATYRGRCPTCASARERATHPNKALYATAKWQNTRRRVLFEQPLCACGCGQIATDVDHITPIAEGGDPWARHNLQALAAPCHSRKTSKEMATR